MENKIHKVLALKYRPKNFKELIGQDVMVQTITNSINSNKLPNAYLLNGIRGVGKTTTARLIAKALNCNKNFLKEENCSCNNCEEISNSKQKIKKYVPLSKRQDKPDSALWLIKNHNVLKDSQIAKLVGITKNTVTSIRNKSYWNYNNLNPKDPVALNLFSQKDLIEANEKAERRIKRERKEKEKQQNTNNA